MQYISERTVLLFACSMLFISSGLYSQESPDYEFPAVIVSASRIPTLASDITRTITIVSRDELSLAADRSIQGVLAHAQGVDVRRRGPNGIQADVAIRGGSFEQTLILINGIAVNDVQTGHNSMNIPLTFDDIERVEILKGPGSRGFGANAFNGIINIITRNAAQPQLQLSGSAGDFGLYEGRISASMPLGVFQQRISYEQKHSDGYRENTDYELHTISYGLRSSFSNAILDVQAGYTDSQFGANGFYSSRFPMQWEHTKTGFASAALQYKHGLMESQFSLSWRNGGDEFLLDRTDPAFYRNVHSSNKYRALYSATMKWAAGTTISGVEAQLDNINSTNLGQHQRNSGGVFVEHSSRVFDRMSMSVGGYAHNYDNFGWKFSPGIDAAYWIHESIKVYASASKSFRTPSFTELYYEDPANLGNENLQAEDAWTYELGSSFNTAAFRLNASVFNRNASNLIDWVRSNENDPWQVMNFSEITTRGLELSIATHRIPAALRSILRHVKIGYSYLDSEMDDKGQTSKYVLEHLWHQIVMNLAHYLPLSITASWQTRILKRADQGSEDLVADLRLMKDAGSLEFHISATNIFNVSYREIGTVPMPGRWIQGGVSYRVGLE
jgi:vitamin B12 transporter